MDAKIILANEAQIRLMEPNGATYEEMGDAYCKGIDALLLSLFPQGLIKGNEAIYARYKAHANYLLCLDDNELSNRIPEINYVYGKRFVLESDIWNGMIFILATEGFKGITKIAIGSGYSEIDLLRVVYYALFNIRMVQGPVSFNGEMIAERIIPGPLPCVINNNALKDFTHIFINPFNPIEVIIDKVKQIILEEQEKIKQKNTNSFCNFDISQTRDGKNTRGIRTKMSEWETWIQIYSLRLAGRETSDIAKSVYNTAKNEQGYHSCEVKISKGFNKAEKFAISALLGRFPFSDFMESRITDELINQMKVFTLPW